MFDGPGPFKVSAAIIESTRVSRVSTIYFTTFTCLLYPAGTVSFATFVASTVCFATFVASTVCFATFVARSAFYGSSVCGLGHASVSFVPFPSVCVSLCVSLSHFPHSS